LVLVALFANTLPLFCSLLGFLILGEKITKVEVICLVLAFYGIYVLLYYGDSAKDSGEKQTEYSIWPIFMLISGPFLMAVTNICLRYMRSLHEYTASTYSVLYSIVIYGMILACSSSNNITMLNTFSPGEISILVFVSIAGGAGMIFKTKALQYEMAGRLGILCYFSIIFTFFFDLIFIGTTFNQGEMYGVAIVFLANLISAAAVFKRNFFTSN
jgi:drug/metabolite transporter (DMT)-like permease